MCLKRLPQLDTVYLLPTFHYSAIQLIQTSSLFGQGDADLLAATSSFLYNVNPVNDSINKLNVVFSDTQPSLQHKKNTYVNFYQSPLLERFKRKQKDLQAEITKLTRTTAKEMPANAGEDGDRVVSGGEVSAQDASE